MTVVIEDDGDDAGGIMGSTSPGFILWSLEPNGLNLDKGHARLECAGIAENLWAASASPPYLAQPSARGTLMQTVSA